MNPTNTNLQHICGQSKGSPDRLDTIQRTISTLQASIAAINATVLQNQQNHGTTLNQIYIRTTSRFESAANDQQQQIHLLGQSFLQQMKKEQVSTNNLIQTLLANNNGAKN
jgi:hypothetical protein